MFQIMPHTADVGIRVDAPDAGSLFADAARAMLTLLVANPAEVGVDEVREFQIVGSDWDFLLVDWLSELLYVFDRERLLFREFTVHLDETGLRATARGERWDSTRHQLQYEIKAVTYHGLCVQRAAGRWQATVILDI